MRLSTLLATLLMGLVIACNHIPVDPAPAPNPPEVKPVKILTDSLYKWENSDSAVPGKAILILHPSFTADVLGASVNEEAMQFLSVYNGKEIWFASHGTEYYGRANLTVETHNSIYKTVIKDEPVEPPPTTGTRQDAYYHGQKNGDRATCFFWPIPRTMNVKLYFDGKFAMTVKDSAVRQNGANGMLWKPVAEWDVRKNGPAGIGEYGVKHKSCYIEW